MLIVVISESLFAESSDMPDPEADEKKQSAAASSATTVAAGPAPTSAAAIAAAAAAALPSEGVREVGTLLSFDRSAGRGRVLFDNAPTGRPVECDLRKLRPVDDVTPEFVSQLLDATAGAELVQVLKLFTSLSAEEDDEEAKIAAEVAAAQAAAEARERDALARKNKTPADKAAGSTKAAP